MPPCAGLVEGHAYSILSAKVISGTALLQLRNPWGRMEWRKDWSDGDSAHWTPAARAQLGAADTERLVRRAAPAAPRDAHAATRPLP